VEAAQGWGNSLTDWLRPDVCECSLAGVGCSGGTVSSVRLNTRSLYSWENTPLKTPLSGPLPVGWSILTGLTIVDLQNANITGQQA
jgi:hypothetical protein